MALHRKFDAMLRSRPDIAVVCECAEPRRLQALAGSIGVGADTVWVGDNCNKGLAVFAFNGYAVSLSKQPSDTLRRFALQAPSSAIFWPCGRRTAAAA